METLLSVNNLSVSFGSQENKSTVVDNISFSINKGETFVLLGESGSGKSVSALSTMRLLPPTANIDGGSIKLNNQDLLALPESKMRDIRGGRVGMIFQEPQSSLNPVLTAGQQIGETLIRHKGLKADELNQRVIELLNDVGIPEPERRMNDYPHQFSGGMKQRIMIAIALAAEPELLIADEPTTALDVTIQAQVLELLKTLQREKGMAILFITHDLGVTAQIADRIAVMRYGKIVEMKDKDELINNPEHEYTKKLFDAVPGWNKREKTELQDTNAETVLKVQNLKVYYPIKKGVFKRTVGHVKAVDGVSIDIKAGQTIAMVGESGSGKTTMGKGVLQLIKPTDGVVEFEGQNLSELSAKAMRAKRTDIQIVFQDPFSSMNPRMMIKDIIEEGMVVQNIMPNKQERLARIDELLTQVGLEPEHKYRYPHEFSGGQRQRVCIARALAVEPKLIICDEPTSALDVSVQAQILELLKSLQKQYDLAYLFITHNISVVEYLAHYVAVMYKGKIVEQGTVDEVLFNPQQEYTKQLLAAVPRIETAV